MKTILYRSLSQSLSRKLRFEHGGRGADYIQTDYIDILQTQTNKRLQFSVIIHLLHATLFVFNEMWTKKQLVKHLNTVSVNLELTSYFIKR